MRGEEDETMEHLLCEWHALARQRMNYFVDGFPERKEFKVLPHHPLCGNDGASLGV
jgi:hypothetical protein